MPAAEVMVITSDAQANARGEGVGRRVAGVDPVGADGSVDGGDDRGHDRRADVAGHVGDAGRGADLLGSGTELVAIDEHGPLERAMPAATATRGSTKAA